MFHLAALTGAGLGRGSYYRDRIPSVAQNQDLTRRIRVKLTGAHPFVLTFILASGALIATVLKTGVGIHPEWHRLWDGAIHWQDISQSPLLAEGDASLRSNIVGSWLSGVLGFSSAHRYLFLAFFFAAIAIMLPILLSYRSDSRSRVKLAFIFVAGGSLAPIALTWIGGYDTVSIIALTVAVMVRNHWVSSLAWFVLALNHSPVALLALVAWLPIAWLIWQRDGLIRFVTSAGSVAAGVIAMHEITNAWGGSADRLTLFQAIPFDTILNCYLTMLPLTTFSVLGVGWVVLVDRNIRSSIIGRVLILETLAISLTVPLIAIDASRIAGLIVIAPIFAWVAHADISVRSAETIWRHTWFLATVVPVFLVWQGALLHPGWNHLEIVQRALDGQVIRGL